MRDSEASDVHCAAFLSFLLTSSSKQVLSMFLTSLFWLFRSPLYLMCSFVPDMLDL